LQKTGSNNFFTNVVSNIGDIYAGPGGLAVTNVSTRKVSYYTTTGGVAQGGPGNMFAVTSTDGAGSAQLYGLTPGRSQIYSSTNLTVTNPSWSLLPGGNKAKIVGGGGYLWAVQGVTQVSGTH
jgi:hypothetical protein